MGSLAKSTLFLMVVTIICKVSGLVREMILMYFYGTSMYSDIYITSMNIPLVLFATIGSALANTFIPLYHENLQKGGKDKGESFLFNVLGIILIMSILISTLAFVFAEPLVKLFAMNFEGEKLILTIKFVRIMIIGILFISISHIISSYLQVCGKFSMPGLIALPNNIVIIFSIIISVLSNNIFILPIGALAGMIAQFLFILPVAIKNGFKLKFKFNFRDEYIKKMIILVGPVLIGVAVSQINTMVDRSLASSLGDGIISALNSANRLNLFVTGLFISTLSAVIYPTLSKLSIQNNKEEFNESIVRIINVVILLILPITVGAIVLSNPIVKIIFERGAFNEKSTLLTSGALICYSIGMIGFGLRDILGKVFYSLKDTKTPMINGLISMILNVILNLILIKKWGHLGLALATSISSMICVCLLFVSLKKKIGYFGQDKMLKTFLKSATSAIVMGYSVHYSFNIIENIIGTSIMSQITNLLSTVIIGVIVYGIMATSLRVEEVSIFIKIVINKFKERKLAL